VSLALISFSRLRNEGNACALSIAHFAFFVFCVLSLVQSTCYPFNSIWITSKLPALVIFLAAFVSAAALTSVRLFVVYFHLKCSSSCTPSSMLSFSFSFNISTPLQAACQEASRNHPNRCRCHLLQQRRQMQWNSH